VIWFEHCSLRVCKSNIFPGAVTEVEKSHVSPLLFQPVMAATIDISGRKCHDPRPSLMKFNPESYSVSVCGCGDINSF